ncbi:MAG: hypothetical protein ACKVVP_03180 [Chloroflexota bacterium]
MMSPTRFRRLWIITCLMLLGGLATAVPVNCICAADQHWGQAIHPIYAHVHADGRQHEVANPLMTLGDPRPSTSEASWIASEPGSLLGMVFDGSISGRAAAWLLLLLIPMRTIAPFSPRILAGVAITPATGPPRSRHATR